MKIANLDRGVNSCNHVEIKIISLGESRAISGSLRIFLRRIVKLQYMVKRKKCCWKFIQGVSCWIVKRGIEISWFYFSLSSPVLSCLVLSCLVGPSSHFFPLLLSSSLSVYFLIPFVWYTIFFLYRISSLFLLTLRKKFIVSYFHSFPIFLFVFHFIFILNFIFFSSAFLLFFIFFSIQKYFSFLQRKISKLFFKS